MATGGIITSGKFAMDLKTLAFDWFGMDIPLAGTLTDKIFKQVDSKDKFEDFYSAYGLGLMQSRDETQAPIYDSMGPQGRATLVPREYALGYMITEQAIRFGKSAELAKFRSMELKKSAMLTKDLHGVNVLNRAFDTTNYATGWDSKALCTTDHPTEEGGNVSNELSISSDFNEAALEQMVIDIATGYRDARGHLTNSSPVQLIVPTATKFDAIRTMKNTMRPGTSDRDINALVQSDIFNSEILSSPKLTDTNAFFALTDVPMGLVMVQNRPLEMKHIEDKETEVHKFIAIESYVPSWVNPLGVFGCPGSS